MITVTTEEGRYETAETREEASEKWEMLESNGYTPVEFTGDI